MVLLNLVFAGVGRLVGWLLPEIQQGAEPSEVLWSHGAELAVFVTGRLLVVGVGNRDRGDDAVGDRLDPGVVRVERQQGGSRPAPQRLPDRRVRAVQILQEPGALVAAQRHAAGAAALQAIACEARVLEPGRRE